MTRPDSRLLVKASALPVVPDGLTVWVEGRDYPHVAICGRPASPSGGFACLGGRRKNRAESPPFVVDLSAPDQQNGFDVRLDALGWALDVLGWSYGAAVVMGTSDATLHDLEPDDRPRAAVVAALHARSTP